MGAARLTRGALKGPSRGGERGDAVGGIVVAASVRCSKSEIFEVFESFESFEDRGDFGERGVLRNFGVFGELREVGVMTRRGVRGEISVSRGLMGTEGRDKLRAREMGRGPR